jgi:hypothetical protein
LRIHDLFGRCREDGGGLTVGAGAQPATLQRLLRLTGLEVVADEGGRFVLTSLGRSVCAGRHAAAGSAIFMGSPAVWSAWRLRGCRSRWPGRAALIMELSRPVAARPSSRTDSV